jgi:NCS1 family nucleobase:cation symporter-1
MWATGVLSILLALVIPMERYQGFLLLLGAMFVPLYGVVLTDYLLIRRRRLDLSEIDRAGGAYWYTFGYHRAALVAWAFGFATYQAIQLLGPAWGGTIPSMVVAGALYYAAWRKPAQTA